MSSQGVAHARQRESPDTRLKPVWVLLGLALLAGLLYGWAINAPYYMDDFGFFYGQSENLWEFFGGRSGGAHAYRPLEGMILVLIQQSAGFATWPIHLLAISAHTALGLLLFLTARRIGASFLEAAIGATFFLIASINVSAVMGNDTLSQVLSGLFGCAGTVLMWLALGGGTHRPAVHDFKASPYCLGFVCLALALLFKETAAGYLLISALLILLLGRRDLRQLLSLGVPLGILAAGFVLLRHSARSLPAAGESGYSLQFAPLPVAKKLAMLVMGILSPVSTVDVFLASQQREWTVLLAAGTASLLLITVVLFGLQRTGRMKLGLALSVAGCLSLFPAVFLGQVSELYAYNGTFFFFLACGLGLGGASRAVRSQSGLGASLVLMTLGFGALMASGTVRKTALMETNGRRATVAVAAIAAKLKETPPGGRILLQNGPIQEREYSVYLRSQFNVVEFGCRRLGRILGRPDVFIDIVGSSAAATKQPGDIVLSLRDGCIVESEKVLGCGI